MTTTSERQTAARVYGVDLVEALEESLPTRLERITPLVLTRFVQSLSLEAVEALLARIVAVHHDHADALRSTRWTGAPDEVVVLDGTHAALDPASASRLLLYAELIVCPDPLLAHPLALRRLAPDSFGGPFPYTDGHIREQLNTALDFYVRFVPAIRAGLLLPTSLHVAASVEQEIHSHFVGPGFGNAPWRSLGPAIEAVLRSSLTVAPATLAGGRLVIHSFDTVDKAATSQIAIRCEGEPPYVETYLRLVGHEENANGRQAFFRQGSPRTPEELDEWVQDCQRKLIYNRVSRLRADVIVASQLGGAVVTSSLTNQRLLGALVTGTSTTPASLPVSAAAVAAMELPVLERLDIARIVAARADSDALANFRVGFRRACAAIKGEVGSPTFQREVDNITRDTVVHGLRELGQASRALHQKTALDVVLTVAAVTLSFGGLELGQLQWVPATLGAANQLRSVFDVLPKRDELRKHPQFMLWSMLGRPFRVGP